MPVDTIIVITSVGAAFVFFAAMLAYADFTWQK